MSKELQSLQAISELLLDVRGRLGRIEELLQTPLVGGAPSPPGGVQLGMFPAGTPMTPQGHPVEDVEDDDTDGGE